MRSPALTFHYQTFSPTCHPFSLARPNSASRFSDSGPFLSLSLSPPTSASANYSSGRKSLAKDKSVTLFLCPQLVKKEKCNPERNALRKGEKRNQRPNGKRSRFHLLRTKLRLRAKYLCSSSRRRRKATRRPFKRGGWGVFHRKVGLLGVKKNGGLGLGCWQAWGSARRRGARQLFPHLPGVFDTPRCPKIL